MNHEERKRIVDSVLPKKQSEDDSTRILCALDRCTGVTIAHLTEVIHAQGFIGDKEPLRQLAVKVLFDILTQLNKDDVAAIASIVLAPGVVDAVQQNT